MMLPPLWSSDSNLNVLTCPEMHGLTRWRVFGDSHVRRGAHRIDAGVGVAGVRAPVRKLHVVQDQAAVRRDQDPLPVRTHRNAVPSRRTERERTSGTFRL